MEGKVAGRDKKIGKVKMKEKRLKLAVCIQVKSTRQRSTYTEGNITHSVGPSMPACTSECLLT